MTLDYLPSRSHIPPLSSSDPIGGRLRGIGRSNGVKILEEKLTVPNVGMTILRPRLQKILERSVDQYGATLICGRAGTGKTALAADFLKTYEDAAWYSIEATDTNWEAFATYFATGLFGQSAGAEPLLKRLDSTNVTKAGIATFLTECIDDLLPSPCPRVLVLDNIHYLYDAEWFPNFFIQLLTSVSSQIHIMMLCRSKPPLPLWRLRSKQMLNVIDEDGLGFNAPETKELCNEYGVSLSQVVSVQRRTTGRVSKLVESLRDLKASS